MTHEIAVWPLDGTGIALAFDGGGEVVLTPGAAPFAFPGEAAVTGRLLAGPILDLNVMVRRGRAVARVERLRAGQDKHGALALVATSAARFARLQMEKGDVPLGVSVGKADTEAFFQ